MKKLICLALLLSVVMSTSTVVAYKPETVPVNPTLLKTYQDFFPATVIQVTDGVYVARGYNRDNPVLIEGTNGLIVVDPGESIPAAQIVKDAFNAHLDNIFDKKPVKAIIYTHHHDCHVNGASVFAGEQTEIYGHESLVSSMYNEWFGQVYPSRVVGGVKMSGMMFMNAPYQDGKGWFVGYVLGGPTTPGPSGFLPPTRTVKDELKTTIAGVEIDLIPVAGETQDVLLVWLPRKQVLIEIAVLYGAFPALTTMRGSGQRNPLDYINTLKIARSLNADYLVALHGANPVTIGEENVRQYLTNFSDAIQFMHDQTVQYMNKDFTPGEIKDLIQLPPHLTSNPYLQETYGSKDWDIYHIFRYYRGYYTDEVRDLFPQSPLSEAQMSAELAGGVAPLAIKAQEALVAGKLEWALRLADDALLLEPDNASAFETKKAAMLALAGNTMNSQARNMLLSDYLLMTGQVKPEIPFDDAKGLFATMDDNAVLLMPMDTLHRIMAVNLNASKS
jgi:alkyl sulfatase BDS1-like metallo-beta-lactamase superfamily hydrolase